jgi:hypothetical protein
MVGPNFPFSWSSQLVWFVQLFCFRRNWTIAKLLDQVRFLEGFDYAILEFAFVETFLLFGT